MSAASSSTYYLPVRQDWLDRRTEEILEPDLPIVDPHHHLWDRARLALPARRAAGRPEQRPQHRRDGLPPVRRDVPRRRPGGAAAGRRDRVRQRRRGDERQRRATARPASAPASSATPTCARRARRRPCWRRTSRAGGGRFRGIRHISAWDADPAVLQPVLPAAAAGCWPTRTSARASRAWPRSACPSTPGSTTRSSPSLTDLARAFPDTTIVLNHVGGPLGDRRLRRAARRGLRRLGGRDPRRWPTCPNVVRQARRAGHAHQRLRLPRRAASRRPPSALAAAWRPYVETCIEAFGADALHVREQLPGRQGLLQLRRLLERLQAAGAAARAPRRRPTCSAGTAARFYRLETASRLGRAER